MAKSFLTDIQLNNNVLLNAKIQAWGSTPTGTTNPNGSGTAVQGQISSYLGELYIFTGSTGSPANSWVKVGGGKVTIGNTDVNVNGSAVTTFTGLSSVTSTTFVGALTGNASTATTLQTARAINGVNFDGSAAITVTAAAGTLTGNTLNSGVTASSLTSVGTLANLTVTNTITGSITGNAGTATTLATARTINGVSFNGSANITVTAAAGTLTGNTLNSGVTASSLTSVGTLAGLTMGAAIAMGTNKITGLGTPSDATDAATKGYVDTSIANTQAGFNVHTAVRVATTANLTGTYTAGTTDASQGTGIGATFVGTAANVGTIDGVLLVANDRVLLKNQTDQKHNGIYTVTTVSTNITLTRTSDFDNSIAGEVFPGDLVYVTAGTTNGGSTWAMNSTGTATTPTNAIRIGTDNIAWVQFAGTTGGVLSGANGGTGVANTGKTITVSGNTTIGSSTHTVAFITGGNTSVTLPTSGTLLSNPVSVSSGGGTSLAIAAGATTSTSLGSTGGALTLTGGNALSVTDEGGGGTVTIQGGGGSGSGGFGGSVLILGGGGPTAGGIYIGRQINGTAAANLISMGAGGVTTTITGNVVLPTVANSTAGFVKTASDGTLSRAATVAYSELASVGSTTATTYAASVTTTVARKATGTIGTVAANTAVTVNHGWGLVTAQLFDSSGAQVEVDVTTASGITTFLSPSTALTGYQYVIIG